MYGNMINNEQKVDSKIILERSMKLAYKEHIDEDVDQEIPNQHQLESPNKQGNHVQPQAIAQAERSIKQEPSNHDENLTTDRSEILIDSPKYINQLVPCNQNQECVVTTPNNISLPKIDLNGISPRKSLRNGIGSHRSGDYSIESRDYPTITSNDYRNNNSQYGIVKNDIISPDSQTNKSVIKTTRISQLGSSQVKKKLIQDSSISDQQKQFEAQDPATYLSKASEISRNSSKYPRLEIQDLDEEQKEGNNNPQNNKQPIESERNTFQQQTQEDKEIIKNQLIQQQQQQQQQPKQGIPDDSSNSEEPRKVESVHNIIKTNQFEVENLETIQIDYDSETIEGLSDDQCLELYCEGSIKLKNSQRLECKLAYENLLIDKIRSSTKLIYTNIGLIDNANLISKDFIQDFIVVPIKKENSKYRSVDIKEAFTIQCSDYIHKKIRKKLISSLKMLLILLVILIFEAVIKFVDPFFIDHHLYKFTALILLCVQSIITYSYSTGIQACSNSYIRQAFFYNKIFLFLVIINFICENIARVKFVFFQQEHELTTQTPTLKSKEEQTINVKMIAYYVFAFIISISIPVMFSKSNAKITTKIRKIVKIVSDENID